jgi:hypothetical protein
MSTIEKLRLPTLYGGGLVLGYACPSRCRHCLYGCGPHRRDGKPDPAALDRLLDLLADRAPHAGYHIGGGEPFLDRELLGRAIAGLAERGLALQYAETNAAWVKSPEQAASTLEELADQGLECVLVSLSPFHAEHVPFARTRWLIDAANAVLPRGAFVWIPDFAAELGAHPADRPLPLEQLLAERGDGFAVGLADRYGLIPAGRAGRYLAAHGRRLPWRELVDVAPCRSRLVDTSHFHVDGDGLYVPGLCAGLVLPLAELPGPLDLAPYPVIATLLEPGGLARLVDRARALGFEPFATYSAPCDLCTHARCFLYDRQPSADLGPDGFYDSRSLPDFADTRSTTAEN